MPLPELLQAQLHAKERSDYWRGEEIKLRKQVVSVYGTDGMETGVERPVLQDGTELRIKHVLNYAVDMTDGKLEHLRAALPPQEFVDLFRQKWEVSVTKYNTLTQSQKEWLAYFNVVTIKPGLSELEIIVPAQERVL